MQKLFFFFLLFTISKNSFAQGEGNIWHFGENAGIDFNSGAAVAITGPINTSEGVASICDAGGNLLFSTDGVTVYNSTLAVMATGLNGSASSTQSAVIVPYPGNSDKYYIFTCDAEGGPNGICYSVVDMTLNGGLGGIVTLNSPLLTSSCEKITAVRNPNGSDFWVVVHAFPSNEFYAYPVTTSGVGTPVITAIGLPISGTSNAIGCMKASPDGHKIVCARCNVVNDPVELFDFDASTGILSNYIPIPDAGNAYGVSFSPDNTKLYVAYANSIDLQQFDLTIANFQNLPYNVMQGSGIWHLGLQLAPDGKIYCAVFYQNYLGVINNPNAAGAACNYVENGFTLFPGTIEDYGLPNFIDNFLVIPTCSVNLGPDVTLCGNDSIILNANSGGISYLWSDGSTNQTLTVTAQGTYWVQKTFDSACIAYDTVQIYHDAGASVSLGNDTVFCSSAYVVFDAGAGFANYSWSNGSTAQSINPVQSGIYSVTVTNAAGCSASDLVSVLFHGINVVLGNDTTICIGSSVVLNAGSGFNNYVWQNGSTNSTVTVSTNGNYTVTVTDSYNCTSSDQQTVTISNPVVNLGNDTLLCNTTNYVLHTTPSFSSYTWQNNSHNPTLAVTATGNYSVTVTNSFGCPAGDSVFIQFSNPEINVGNDTTICSYNTLTLTAASGFNAYNWSDGSSTQNTVADTAAIYSVTVTDAFGCTASDAKEILLDNPVVFIGNDTSNCNGNGIIYDAGNTFSTYQWNDNSSQQNIITSGAGTYSVTVTDQLGCTASDAAEITYNDCQDIDVPSGFTPNGDGHNDYFHILNAQNMKLNFMRIYDRWGNLIYSTNNVANYWDGKFNGVDCEVDVYTYYIKASNFLNHPISKQGNITLLR